MKKRFEEDTIVALATPPGVGAIAVIRVSGPKALTIADAIFKGAQKLNQADGHSIKYGRILEGNDIVDDVLASVFKAPNSYTGENVVELSSHGSPYIIKKIIELLINKGARSAEPGEFTKRAFLNNRIDLAQAEAVADVIESRTSASLRGARNQLDGLLSAKVEELREQLIDVSALLELELDFSEEDVKFVDRKELMSRISSVLKEIEKLIKSYGFGKVAREGVNVAIVGEPNVGKSSILNYILKESRAIVSSIPGTTRDIIREDISIDGFLFRLYDTAGIRISEDELEKEGIIRSRNALKIADIVMFVMDFETGFSDSIEKEIAELNPKVKTIKVLNKIDLAEKISSDTDFNVSAKTGDGMEELIDGLKNTAFGARSYTEEDVLISSLRHLNCLKSARVNLLKAAETAKKNMSSEFVASDIRAAENSLFEIVGKIAPDDILNSIFSKFCIGK